MTPPERTAEIPQRDYLEELRVTQRGINEILTAAGREVNYLRSMVRTLSHHLPKDHPYWPGISDILSGRQPGLFDLGYQLIDEMVLRGSTGLRCELRGYVLRIAEISAQGKEKDGGR